MSPPIHDAKSENVITHCIQCKNFIATMVIIAGMLDTSEKYLAEPIPPHKVGKNPLIFKLVSD